MKLTADFTDELKPDELEELVLLSREQQVPMGKLILQSARALVGMRRKREPETANREQPKAA
jgi:hypothetical protein